MLINITFESDIEHCELSFGLTVQPAENSCLNEAPHSFQFCTVYHVFVSLIFLVVFVGLNKYSLWKRFPESFHNDLF